METLVEDERTPSLKPFIQKPRHAKDMKIKNSATANWL